MARGRGCGSRLKLVLNSWLALLMKGIAESVALADVWQYATAFRARYNRLDVLIHNAGATYSSYQENDDGVELTFAGQVVGPFLLTWLLLPHLLAASPSRVIVVSSAEMHAQPLAAR